MSGVFQWSQTGTANASADPTVNYTEGQVPSSLNDSARNAMASVAKWRDDIAGAIVTTGTNTGYIVSSYQQFTSLAAMSGQVISFTPHVTNAGTQAFLNVDSLGSKTLRLGSGLDVPPGTLVQGTPYEAVYSAADGAFYLKGFYGNPYNIPIGSTIEWWSNTLPNSGFVFPYGQAISRTTYATLFAIFSTYWGPGDGSSTFNIPDLRGRLVACPDVMGSSGDAGRLSGNTVLSSRAALGGVGGEAVHSLAVAEIPTLSASGSGSISGGGPTDSSVAAGMGTANVQAGSNPVGVVTAFGRVNVTITGSASVTTATSGTGGSTGAGHNNLQPMILGNRIMRVI